MGTVRDLLPSERTPRGMLAVLFNPDASELAKEAALENFQWGHGTENPDEWSWEPLSHEILAKLDSLRPDRAKGEEAAVRYLNSKEPTVVPVKMSMGLPLAIIFVIVIALGVMAWARVG